MSKTHLFLREYWINNWFDKSVDESLKDLEGDTQQIYRTMTPLVPNVLLGVEIETTGALFHMLEILSWDMQKVKKPHNQNL